MKIVSQKTKDLLVRKVVFVQIPNGKKVMCVVTGRMLQFALLYPVSNDLPAWEFSWQAVQRAVENNSVLKV